MIRILVMGGNSWLELFGLPKCIRVSRLFLRQPFLGRLHFQREARNDNRSQPTPTLVEHGLLQLSLSSAIQPKPSANREREIPSALMGLQGRVDAKFYMAIAAPPLRLAPRHFLEIGNPQVGEQPIRPEAKRRAQ